MKLRVWWVPQFPMESFLVDVKSVSEAVKILDVLADYDLFQLENRIKPEYSNSGGLQMFDPNDDTDSPEGSWVDWCDEASGEDDPWKYLEAQSVTEKG